MKITFFVPKEGDKWKLRVGRANFKRKELVNLLRFFHDRMPKVLKKYGEQSVQVDYGDGFTGESLKSKDCLYLTYCGICFLEDYLSDTVIHKWEKVWLSKMKDNSSLMPVQRGKLLRK